MRLLNLSVVVSKYSFSVCFHQTGYFFEGRWTAVSRVDVRSLCIRRCVELEIVEGRRTAVVSQCSFTLYSSLRRGWKYEGRAG